MSNVSIPKFCLNDEKLKIKKMKEAIDQIKEKKKKKQEKQKLLIV